MGPPDVCTRALALCEWCGGRHPHTMSDSPLSPWRVASTYGRRASSRTRSSESGPPGELQWRASHRPQLWNSTSSPAMFIRISTIPALAHRLHCMVLSSWFALVKRMSADWSNFLEDDQRMSRDDSRDDTDVCAGQRWWREQPTRPPEPPHRGTAGARAAGPAGPRAGNQRGDTRSTGAQPWSRKMALSRLKPA